MDTIGKIKRLLEDLQYRTDEKSAEEIYHLALTLFELAAEHRFSNAVDHPSQSVPEPPVAPSLEPLPPPETKESAPAEPAEPAEAATGQERPESAEEKPTPAEPADSEVAAGPEEVEPATTPAPAEPAEVAAGPEPSEPAKPSQPSSKQPGGNPQSKMKIGFNDRFAFINKLFHGDAEEYNNIIAAIEGMSDFHQAENYINMVVKPDFDWSEAEEYEERFMACIEQHFS